jgi:hypothetical protein
MSSGEQFVIAGKIAGCTVGATWDDGTITGDALLVAAAQVIISSGLTVNDDGRSVRASFRTMSGAAIALMRALDDIESVRVSAPTPVPAHVSLPGD